MIHILCTKGGLKIMRAFVIITLTFLSVISWDAFLKIKVMKRTQRNKTLFLTYWTNRYKLSNPPK